MYIIQLRKKIHIFNFCKVNKEKNDAAVSYYQ